MKKILVVKKQTITSFNGANRGDGLSRTSVVTVTACPWCPKPTTHAG